MTLMVRDQEKSEKRAKELPLMLEKLHSAPDFYAEMKWEFTTWSKWAESTINDHMTYYVIF